MAFKTANPALNANTFTDAASGPIGSPAMRSLSPTAGGVMTLDGTVGKSFILTALLIFGGAWTWRLFYLSHDPSTVMPWLWAGCIGGLIVAMITCFNKTAAPITAPIYAVLEGFALGGISCMLEAQYPGIVMQAVGLTVGTLVALLLAYTSKLIQVTEHFKLGVVAATGGICIVYIIDLVLRFFGMHVPFINDSGPIGIGVSVVIVIIAALNLVLDFDFIEQGARVGAPKYMEWYAAFGLLVTLVWLYLEILRLLAKMRRR
jgi:uncharacterized YccA/Bax inhibitor family protein